MTRVSYIITSYNRSAFLSKALDNIREFLTKKDELIVVDGGSKDSTHKVVKKNADIITEFISQKDFGEAHALNKGMLLAKGKYIKILTDDDYIHPDKMKYAVSILEKNPKIDALQCGGTAYFSDRKSAKKTVLFYEQIFPGIKITENPLHLMTYAPCGLGLIFKKEILPIIGLFDIKYRAVDLYIMSRIILHKLNFKYLNINLYDHFNYEHSGENFVNDIHKEEAKVFIDYKMWPKFINFETKIISDVLGLSTEKNGFYFVRIVKLLDKIRTGRFSFLIQFCGLILGLLAKVKTNLGYFKVLIKNAIKKSTQGASNFIPLEPDRDGKFW